MINSPKESKLSSLNLLTIPIYLTLTLLGDLMPGLKIKPVPSAFVLTEKGEKTYFIKASDTSIKIEKSLQVPNPDICFYGIYHLETGETYKSAIESLSNGYMIEIESKGRSFGSIPAREIINQFAEKYPDS